MNRLSRTRMRGLAVGLLSLAFLLAGALPAVAQVAKLNQVVSMKDGLKQMLQKEGAAKLTKVDVAVSADQARPLRQQHGLDVAGNYTVYRGLTAAGALVGAVVIVNEQGKEGPLQVLVALRPDSKIYDVGFTVFGEDKGKSALSWGYLKQYIGKSSADPLVLGKDIDGVSGATWTSTSVAQAVKKAVVVYNAFVREGS